MTLVFIVPLCLAHNNVPPLLQLHPAPDFQSRRPSSTSLRACACAKLLPAARKTHYSQLVLALVLEGMEMNFFFRGIDSLRMKNTESRQRKGTNARWSGAGGGGIRRERMRRWRRTDDEQGPKTRMKDGFERERERERANKERRWGKRARRWRWRCW